MATYISRILNKWLSPLEDSLPSVYMVGGAVRDYLLSYIPKDIDLVCSDAAKLADSLAHAKDVTVVPFIKKADEPCYRVVDRYDKKNFIDISLIRGDTILKDLERRDFTINAMAIKIEQTGVMGEVIDPLNGMHDLRQKLIRSVGPDTFTSDPLRILRAFRFAAELEFTITETTLKAVKKKADLLKQVSAERIAYELIRIFSAANSVPFVKMMDELGVLEVVFPEIIIMKGCTQNFHHHLDVWRHSLAVLENCENIINRVHDFFGAASNQVQDNIKCNNRIPLLKLSAMLHDAGKPEVKAVDHTTGRITFYGHDRKGEKIVSEITDRLKMSNKDKEYVRTLVANHMHIHDLFSYKVKKTTRIRWFRKLTDDIIPVIILGMADIQATLGPMSSKYTRNQRLKWCTNMVSEYYEKIKKKLESKNFVSGKDLIAMGLAPGPEMGLLLKKTRIAQDTGVVKDRQAALDFVKRLRARSKTN